MTRQASQDVTPFVESGFCEIAPGLDATAAKTLSRILRAARNFDSTLFMEEAAYRADPVHRGVNPKPGRNLLENYSGELDFVERDPALVETLTEVLGHDYEILLKKLICGVPRTALPEWVAKETADVMVNNLGPYIRPEFRDVTYFMGIDYHQDIIDWRNHPPDFITLYVYLDAVGPEDAPLHLLPKTHQLGATTFPHAVSGKDDSIHYRNDDGSETLTTSKRILLGGAGYAAFWHSFVLHGTQPVRSDNARISLRYLIKQKDGTTGTLLDKTNEGIRGNRMLSTTRVDYNIDAKPIVRGNTINGIFAASDPGSAGHTAPRRCAQKP